MAFSHHLQMNHNLTSIYLKAEFTSTDLLQYADFDVVGSPFAWWTSKLGDCKKELDIYLPTWKTRLGIDVYTMVAEEP